MVVRHRRVSAAVAISLVLTGVAGCGGRSSDPPGLEGIEAGGGAGVQIAVTSVGMTYPFGSLPMCVRSGGAIDAIEVKPVELHGSIEVVGVYARSFPQGTESDLRPGKPLPPDLVPIEQFQLAGRCAAHSMVAEAVIVVARAGPGDGTIGSFDVSYRQGDDSGHVRWPFFIELCDPTADTHLSECGTTG